MLNLSSFSTYMSIVALYGIIVPSMMATELSFTAKNVKQVGLQQILVVLIPVLLPSTELDQRSIQVSVICC